LRFLITKGLLPTVKWIKGRRISWLGHLERMEEDRMPKKIFTQELEGTRRRGRPRKGESRKRSSSAGSEKMERVGGRSEKNGRTSSKRQSSQWAVVPMEKERVITQIFRENEF
jgi:hypothetical protein